MAYQSNTGGIMSGFKLTDGRGFHLTFSNGVILSTQFGSGNYCDNYDYPFTPKPFSDKAYLKHLFKMPASSNVEIMIFTEDKNLTNVMLKELKKNYDPDDVVMGYVGFDDWIDIVNWCNNYKPIPTSGG